MYSDQDYSLHFAEVASAALGLSKRLQEIEEWSAEILAVVSAGGRVLIVGNGGCCSLADHFVAELAGSYRRGSPTIDAINLQASAAALTAISNDIEFTAAASRAIAAHGRAGDILICLSTSGSSENILAAVREAKRHSIQTFALIGRPVYPLVDMADRAFSVEADDVATVQELQLIVLHAICHTMYFTRAAA
jgi:D-sedoheptulose 7-phosphate isomerase